MIEQLCEKVLNNYFLNLKNVNKKNFEDQYKVG